MPELDRAKALVKYHKHFSGPFAVVVLLIIGLPFVLRQNNANIFIGVGICIIVCAAYIFIDLLSIELGDGGPLSPAAAAWFPVLLFGSAGVFIFDWLIRT